MKKRGLNKTIILTFDYELFLKESGSLENCLINPTEKLRKTLNEYNINATFFIDILYFYKLLQFPELEHQAIKVKDQIQELAKDGHNIELHLHPQWLEAVYHNGQWIFPDLKIYSLQQLSEKEIIELFKTGIESLENICKAVIKDYKVTSFRAGGLCIIPFEKIKSSFDNFNIKIDSSVAKGLKAKSIYHNYDFTNIPVDEIYWFDNDPLHKKNNGHFLEIPMTVYEKSILDKIKAKFIYNTSLEKNTRFSLKEGKSLGPTSNVKITGLKKISSIFKSYLMLYSLDNESPDFIINKVKNSDKKLITFISHNKFLSENSLITISKLSDAGYKFETIQSYYKKNAIKINLF